MRLRLLAVLAIALSATACETSLPLDNRPPPDLAGAEARAQEAVDHPQPPAVLQLSQDSTRPWMEGAEDAQTYHCPMPPDLKNAIDSGAPMDVVASKAIGDLQKETDLRFRALDWNAHPHGATPPPVETAEQKPTPKPAPPKWQFWNW